MADSGPQQQLNEVRALLGAGDQRLDAAEDPLIAFLLRLRLQLEGVEELGGAGRPVALEERGERVAVLAAQGGDD